MPIDFNELDTVLTEHGLDIHKVSDFFMGHYGVDTLDSLTERVSNLENTLGIVINVNSLWSVRVYHGSHDSEIFQVALIRNGLEVSPPVKMSPTFYDIFRGSSSCSLSTSQFKRLIAVAEDWE